MAAPKGNKFALGLTNNGRPPKYSNVDEIEVKINDYFDSLLDEQKQEYTTRPTITGLALYLGFCGRQSFYDYITKKDFSYIIKRAQTIIEMSYEEMLLSKTATGAIFALKNMGWKDKSEVEQTVTDITPPRIEFITNNKQDDINKENEGES